MHARAAQDVLLHETAGKHLDPAIVVNAVRNPRHHAGNAYAIGLEILGLPVRVVPDFDVRRVAGGKALDVALFYAIEKTPGQFAHGCCVHSSISR